MDKYTDLHTGFNDPVTNIGGKCLNHILKPVDNYKYFWKITNPKKQNLTFIHLKCGQSFKTVILGEREESIHIFFGKLCTMIVTE